MRENANSALTGQHPNFSNCTQYTGIVSVNGSAVTQAITVHGAVGDCSSDSVVVLQEMEVLKSEHVKASGVQGERRRLLQAKGCPDVLASPTFLVMVDCSPGSGSNNGSCAMLQIMDILKADGAGGRRLQFFPTSAPLPDIGQTIFYILPNVKEIFLVGPRDYEQYAPF
jgi:hypothetical protein